MVKQNLKLLVHKSMVVDQRPVPLSNFYVLSVLHCDVHECDAADYRMSKLPCQASFRVEVVQLSKARSD